MTIQRVSLNKTEDGAIVTDGLTDAQLRASAVPVSGAFYPTTQPVSAESLPLPAGASSEVTLQSLLSSSTDQGGIFFQLIRLLKKIALPAWFDPSLNRVRETAIIESGTVTTVSTVSTVSNQANIGGYTAEQLIRMQTRSAWAAGQRSRLT